MASRVSFPGNLRDNGHNASCTVTFSGLVTLPGTDDFNYTKMEIQNVSPMLPEGDYVLTVNGKPIPVRYRGGRWLGQR
jgi:hypothetical protein